AEKVLTAQASSTEAAARASYEKTCDACQKTYFSQNAYQNHIGSQKHKARVALQNSATGGPVDETTSVISSTFSLGEPIKPKDYDDSDAEEEFARVVEGIKAASLTDSEPISRRPTRPHVFGSE